MNQPKKGSVVLIGGERFKLDAFMQLTSNPFESWTMCVYRESKRSAPSVRRRGKNAAKGRVR